MTTTPAAFINQVNLIVKNGGSTTTKFETLTKRWDTFTNIEDDMQANLNKAVLDPKVKPAELAQLRALAIAAAGSNLVTQATVRNNVAAEILAALRVEYRTVAAANYETIRERFNELADQLTDALDIVDSEASPEHMVKADTETRTAWADAPAHAHQLSALVPALETAALLAGTTPATGQADKLLIGLTTNAEGLHRRRVWEAWNNTTGRALHWRELWKLGATIEAPALNEIKPYREPKPMETRAERVSLGIRQFEYDPEDDHYEAERDQLQRTAITAGINPIDYTDNETGVHIN